MTAVILRSPVAAARLDRAASWLASHGAARELVIVGPSQEAASHLARDVGAKLGAAFGWHRVTLARLAGALAAAARVKTGRVPAGGVALEALVVRTFHAAAARGDVGRFEPIKDRPGLPRALARTLDELRLAYAPGTNEPRLDDDVARLLAAYEAELSAAGLADRAELLALATARAEDPAPHDLLAKPLLLLDVAITSARERDLVRALAARSDDVLATVPLGDDRSLRFLENALGTSVEDLPAPSGATSLGRLHAGLFSRVAQVGERGDEVVLFSAPGESRECVEIARRIRDEAERGVPFDRTAILLRSPLQYRTHLEEALRRAQIPAYFARGSVRPDPAGRAFLALLACATEDLSARRFAEYLSLGEVPDLPESGAPPEAPPPGDLFVPPDEETVSPALARAAEEDEIELRAAEDARATTSTLLHGGDARAASGTLFVPRHWERLLVEAAVIGGWKRWRVRLDALKEGLGKRRLEVRDNDAATESIDRDLAGIDALTRFALPLLEELSALRDAALPWGDWITRLGALASRALRTPPRVLAVLAELAPMANVGPVDLGEVRLALEGRLSELVVPPSGRPSGRVFVAGAAEARGLAFDVVFVPGLAEKIFPQKVSEDPILTDAARADLGAPLRTNAERAAEERLALRLAVGAATKKIFLSYPRLDLEQSRPRTPSFYALEVLRAAVGALPGFDELARHAESVSGARVGWPAPRRSADAIDEAEHDLALLESVMHRPEAEAVGRAHFLLNANVHLARALRFRGRRWNTRPWKSADGLVDVDPRALPALAAHRMSARSFSPTALQSYAACPYKFVLHTLHKLSPRQEPSPIEELDPLQKGSLVHDTMYELFTVLREDAALPVTRENLAHARGRLDEVLAAVATRYEEKLAPAISRVWTDEIQRIKADLRELLRRAAEDPVWVPTYFELAFGLSESRGGEDPRSTKSWIPLDCGINLRGSIDLIERREGGQLRVTDYKTGKVRVDDGIVINGGKTLQPVLYALAVEKLLEADVGVGALYFCTSTGGFRTIPVALDQEARDAAALVAKTVGTALEEGFLPAAPADGECEWCDFRVVCGPHEERRTRRKERKRLEPLLTLRKSR